VPEPHLASVLSAYGFTPACSCVPVAGGLINQTYRVEESGRRVALQRLNPIFQPTVNLDIDAITTHLSVRGMETPRVVRTHLDGLWTTDEQGGVWRALTWLDGHTVHSVDRPATAHAAGLLVARFHRAVSDLEHTFQFSRPGAHDTPLHLSRLRAALSANQQHVNYPAIARVGEAILAHAEELTRLPTEPVRLIHGDLKISNVLFDGEASEARALLDLDTMAYLTIPIELGDALRSWCNPAGEDSSVATFRCEVFEAAVRGYARGAGSLLTIDERDALPLGAETISLELASRFCADALLESYFGWDPNKFASRSLHNLARAESQLAVAQSIRSQRAELSAVVRAAF
jgi:Ser/Thr protein kinase RdoA (MazF antagonist)